MSQLIKTLLGMDFNDGKNGKRGKSPSTTVVENICIGGGISLDAVPSWTADSILALDDSPHLPPPEVEAGKRLNWERLNQLSEEAQFVVKLALTASFESKTQIKKVLREDFQWMWKHIHGAVKEVENWVRDF